MTDVSIWQEFFRLSSTLGQIDAIGVDEIQYSKGHKYLTLVYPIDLGVTRLLWVGKERTWRVAKVQNKVETIANSCGEWR